MNNIKSFSFYRNYYELVKYLPNKDRLKMYDSILEFIFEDKEPELENLTKGIWVNLKMPLNTSKNNSLRSIGNGAPKGNQNASKKQTKNKPKTNQKQTNNISIFLFLISNNKYIYISNYKDLYNKIHEWLEYKQERKEYYKETGLKNLLSQIEKNVEEHGKDEIIKLISECMSSNYKGIIFDKLKNKPKQENILPKWFDNYNNNEEEQLTDEERRQIERIERGVRES